MSWILVSTVALATYFDLKSRRIPNWLTYGSIGFSFIKFSEFHFVAIGIGIICAIIFGRFVGAGDIKLAVAIAIWTHILSWSQDWIYASFLVGGIAGLIYRRKSLPFAPYMAAGLVIANVARSYGFI